MWIVLRRLLAVLLVVIASFAVVPRAALAAAPDPIAHDPTVIKQGRYYYAVITGDAGKANTFLPMKRSTDLRHWTELGPVFSTPPAWVVSELGVTPADFWAPDITFFAGKYHLYYAASSFGTNNSVIGLATNVTLDPASPRYRWVDEGLVFRSSTVDNFNAIDPEVVLDGPRAWLAFGSFWDGIKMRALDPRTGRLSTADTTLYSLASRGGASIEGPSIVRRGGFWYLFANLDFCCRGVNSDYRVVVGRSTSITGPFTDRDGVPMLAGGGTELLRGYHDFRGPGGGDLVGDFYAHHYYDLADAGAPKLSVRPVSWRGGWPAFGDPLTGNGGPGHGPAYLQLVSRADGRVVSDAGCGYEGADIVLETDTGSPCQQWRPEDRGDGFVSLGNRFSNKVVEVAACIDADGARVAQWGWFNNNCQQFRFVPAGEGWSTIESRLNGRVLQGVGSAIQTFTADSASVAQQFRLQPVGAVLVIDRASGRSLGSFRFRHLADGWYRVTDAAGRSLRGTQWRIEAGGRLVDRAGHVLEVSLETP